MRDCSLVVWHKAQSDAAQVEVIGSWDGWKRPGTILPAKRTDGWRVTGFDLAPGEYSYAIVEDGKWLLDETRTTTALHDGIEVSWAKIDSCGTPALRVDVVDGTHASLTFFAVHGALDPAAIAVDIPAHVDADPATGKIELTYGGLAPGKHVATVTASGATAKIVIWIEPRPFDWRDAPIYQVMVDRYRARDGSALAAPNPMTAFAGGAVEGVRKNLDAIVGMGFRAVWLSPLYRNPDGAFPGEPGKTYTGYHGYWPTDSRVLDPRFATEDELDRFVRDAHARGVRVLFDVVPHHVHQQHPYFSNHSWFEWDGNACTCGDPGCDWATHEQDCWFAPYLPTLDWRNPDVADRITDDVAWWIDRFGGDGVRIDAVPMMPRMASRRIAWKLRTDFDPKTLVLGENFTGPGGYDLLRYQLGPGGLDSQFHFPLMWAMRRAIASEAGALSDVDVAVRSGEDAWKGSGAVMGLIVGNHDVPRFSSVSAGDADLDGWSPSPQPTNPRVYAKQRLALGLAYTLPGAPVVYYGDELALSGRRDPDSRRVMPDESALTSDMRGVRDFVTRLATIRDCSGALRRGTYRSIAATDEVLAFAREIDGAATAVVVATRNPGSIPPNLVPPGFTDLLTGRTGADGMGPLEIAIFQPMTSTCAK